MASLNSPDWMFNETDASNKKKGFGIAGNMLKDKEEKLEASLKLITTLSGPYSSKEYARLLKDVLAEEKRPIFLFFEMLNLNPHKQGKKKLDEVGVVFTLQELPDYCSQLFRFEAFPNDLLHPLHMLCALSASLSTIKACFNLCNAAIFHDSISGSPIHFATSFNASFDVIRWLVKKDPDALHLGTTNEKMTPLHLACQHEADSETVAFLTELGPQAASMLDEDGMTPLHWACSVEEPNLAVIEDLTEVYPEAGIVVACGKTPLLLAIERKAETLVLRDLIASNPKCAALSDCRGFKPLHRAIEMAADIKVLKDLINADKLSIRTTDGAGNLPVHTAVQAGVNDMAVYKLLARKYPGGLEEENHAGETPHTLAKKVLHNSKIIGFLEPFEEVDE